MNHMCVKDLLSKENKHSESKFKRCVNCLKKDGQLKTKRLKTRKERSHMRGAGKDASKTKSHHHHCQYNMCKDSTNFRHSCHHSRGLRREAPFAKVVPSVQEPSIITDSRLIGHHRLFNHEVKSVDIQRLPNEQGHLATGEQTAQGENHPSLAPHVPSPVSTNDILGTDVDDVVPSETKISSVTNIPAKGGEWSDESDLTPGQRPRHHPKSVVTPKNTSPHVGMSQKEKANPVLHKKGKTSQLNPSVDGDIGKMSCKKLKKHKNLNHSLKTPESRLSPNPLQFSSSTSTDTLGPDSCCISQSIAAIASRLRDCVQFPRLSRRDLLAESREVLTEALMDAHGSNRLPAFLLQERRHDLSFGADLTRKVSKYEQALARKDENELMATAESASRVDTVGPSSFDSQNTTTIKHFSLKTHVQPQQSLNLTATLPTNPEDSTLWLSNDFLRRPPSPQLHVDFEPYGAAAGDYLFTSPPPSCWRDKQPSSQRYKPPQSKEPAVFNSFENNFTEHTRAYKENSGGPRRLGSRSFYPCQSRLMDRHSAEPLHFPLKQDAFITEGCSFASTSPAQIHPPHVSSHSLTFSRYGRPSTYPLLSSHQVDVTQYPASQTLERSPTSLLSSLPSPETWSFPPMKLY